MKYAIRVYEGNLKFLFLQNSLASVSQFIDIARDSFWLNKDDAISLAKYIFEQDTYKISTNYKNILSPLVIEAKLREFASNYDAIDDNRLSEILFELIEQNSLENINKLISVWENFWTKLFILPSELRNAIYTHHVKMNSEVLWVLLLRKSISLVRISTRILKNEFINTVKFIKKETTSNKSNKSEDINFCKFKCKLFKLIWIFFKIVTSFILVYWKINTR